MNFKLSSAYGDGYAAPAASEKMSEAHNNAFTKADALIKAVIFDLDGVIVDTAHYHFLAWKRLASELGIELTLDYNEKLKGVSRMRSLELILQLGNITMNENDREILADKKNTWFIEYIERMNPDEIFPGVRSLLEEIKQRGMKVALASSSKNARTVIKLLGIENYFDAVVDGTMVTHTKPHPEIFLTTASLLQKNPAECLVFEDAEAGVEAALRAGMKCIGVGSPEQLSKANKVISKTGDFRVEMLDELK